MSKKFVLATVAAFVLLAGFGYLIHGVLLDPEYAQLPNLMRTADESAKHLPYIMLAQLLAAVSLVWIYEKGRNETPWMGQGIRFGIAAAIFAPAVKFITYYAVQPEPHTIALHQILGEGFAMVIVCVVVARIYK